MSAAPRPLVTLGRDGMGPVADEEDFEAWTAYVCDHIDEATDLAVDVGTRSERDVQDDRIDADDCDRQRIADALQELWCEFCSKPEVQS